MTLEKAYLYCLEKPSAVKTNMQNYANTQDIPFQFNPDSLKFKRTIIVKDQKGTQNSKGVQKVYVEGIEAQTLQIDNIWFDFYEEGEAGAAKLEKIIKQLNKAVESIAGGTVQDENNKKIRVQRPPIFLFIWGDNQYLRCFIKEFSYDLTMFLPNGKPVRAKVSLTLHEASEEQTRKNPALPRGVGSSRWGAI